MKSQDIENMVRWSVDVELRQFSEDAYGVTGTAFEIAKEGDYLRDKFKQMQSNFIMWISGLDSRNKARLSENINNHKGE